MFTVFELMILKEKGLVEWDDPVSKYLKGFTYNHDGWGNYVSKAQLQTPAQVSSMHPSPQQSEPITLRQLASHMAGIGLDYPPIDVSSWPKSVPGDVLWLHHALNASQGETLQTIRDLPLIAPPYTLPAYTNAGFNVLGWALATAAGGEPEDYAIALERDIFEPLGLSSGFNVTKESSPRVAVSSKFPFEVGYDIGSYNPSAGQFSSLLDLITVMQTFLDPSRNNSLLSPRSMREWLRPLHGFPDDFTEMGAPWEIVKLSDSNGNTKRWYSKSGNFLASNSNFIFDPVSSFGVVVLMTGQYRFALELAIQAIQIFQPAFDSLQEQMARQFYGGFWQSDDLRSHADVYIKNGSIWLGGLVLNGTDIFEMLEGGTRYPKTRKYGMWPTGRDDEF
ncbi:hypothetical protein FRC00_007202, partial [Tulasnella sp. 408]